MISSGTTYDLVRVTYDLVRVDLCVDPDKIFDTPPQT